MFVTLMRWTTFYFTLTHHTTQCQTFSGHMAIAGNNVLSKLQNWQIANCCSQNLYLILTSNRVLSIAAACFTFSRFASVCLRCTRSSALYLRMRDAMV